MQLFANIFDITYTIKIDDYILVLCFKLNVLLPHKLINNKILMQV